MVEVKDLTELTLADLWAGVKDEEDWWEDFSRQTLKLAQAFLESAMEAELLERLQAGRFKRTELRRGYRNGYRYRQMVTQLGLMEHLRVPRDRAGSYQPAILTRYQRRQDKVNRLIRELFLSGVSTRRVGQLLQPVLGTAPSPQTVSRVLRSLDSEVMGFHNRLLVDRYQYLLFDGITLKVKSAAGVKKKLVLSVYGITLMGNREMVSFRQARSEAEGQWEAFLRDLYKRGLEGKHLKLVVSDGSKGLQNALDTVYPYVSRQRCWVHKLRNVACRLPRKVQKDCLKGASAIYQAENRREALDRFHQWAAQWRASQPKAVTCIEDDLEELLPFLACPRAHWKKVRTTNAIERAFREVRRRTRPMSCFENAASVDRIIYGVMSHLNSGWRDKPLWNSTHSS